MKTLPAGVPVVMPMLVCRDPAAEIDFCKTTFGALEMLRRPGPDGIVAHAALTISGAMIMIEGEWPTPCQLCSAPRRELASRDLRLCRRRGRSGRTSGSRRGEDPPSREESVLGRSHRADHRPSGHVWTISTRVEETSSAERKERWSSIIKG